MVRGLVAAIAVLISVGLAHAERRIALVIGNSDYAALSSIANARHDVALIGRTLKSLGFEVESASDADLRAMRRAVQGFGDTLEAAGKDAIGVFYFSGHGVQAAGGNHLLPVDARIAGESDLAEAAVSAAGIVARLVAAENALNLVILDASRHNSFQPTIKSGGKGLAAIASGRNVLTALSAAPGRIGTEGAAENSPYALALAEAMVEPGLSIEQVFEKVRARVESMTAGTQSPWESSPFGDEIYLNGAPPMPTPPVVEMAVPAEVVVPVVPAVPAEPAPQPDKEVVFWNTVKDSTNVAVLQTYLDQYPGGTFSPLAQVLIDTLNAEAARQRALEEAEQIRRAEAEKLAALTPPPPAEPEQPASPSEMVELGVGYETGDGHVRDAAKAADLYREALQLGNAEAGYRLGLLFYRGAGVDRDYGEAADHILDAVKAKHAPAVAALSDPTTLNERAFLRTIQERLKALGYYRSGIDGLWGPGSRSAVLALSRGDPIPKDKPETVRRRTRPSTPRSANAPSATGAGPDKRTNPQCSRWGRDFNNPGCAFGL